ncbi:hypothetical protein, partial [Paractinoplanes toevensis]|uniref:hypothetical protein n=1 Tax=Paractinoplanes toevensis TaxID=571911 RepID=UPI001BB451BD
MRDLYILEAEHDGLLIRTGPHTIAEAMAIVDEHLVPRGWQHRYRPLIPLDQALRHFNLGNEPGRPILEADFFVALRRAVLADPEHDGLESDYITGLLAHVDPHRPMQLYSADEEHLLGECDCPRDEHGVCPSMEPADRICVTCTAIIDSNTEFGPWFGPSVM